MVLVGDRRASALAAAGLPDRRSSAAAARSTPTARASIGWDIGGTGFQIVLTAEVADAIEANIASEVDGLLAEHGLTRADIDVWVAHPGGPKVLDAFERGLGLAGAGARRQLALARPRWATCRRVGAAPAGRGCSQQPAGTRGVLFALGPGVTSEYVLLEWAA